MSKSLTEQRTCTALRLSAAFLATVLAGGCETGGSGLGVGLPAGLPYLGQGQGQGAQPAETRSDIELSPAERKLREQSRAFQRTVWEGVLIGAGTGALIQALRKGDTESILKGALVGGAVGGLAGAYVASKQKEFASKEDQLDSMIADVRQSNRETEELIASARAVIAEDKRRLAAAQKRFKAGQATETELKDTKARIGENQAVIAQAGKGAREKQSMFQGAERTFREQNPGADTGRLQQELKAYNKSIESLDGVAKTISVA